MAVVQGRAHNWAADDEVGREFTRGTATSADESIATTLVSEVVHVAASPKQEIVNLFRRQEMVSGINSWPTRAEGVDTTVTQKPYGVTTTPDALAAGNQIQ